MFEHRKTPLLPLRAFYLRVVRSLVLALGIVLGSLGAGMAGYHWFTTSMVNYSLGCSDDGFDRASRASTSPDKSGYSFRMQSRQRPWLNSASECCSR